MHSAVLGDRITTRQIAQLMEERYGVMPQLKSLGSLEALKETMNTTFRADPANVFAWLDKYAMPCRSGGECQLMHD